MSEQVKLPDGAVEDAARGWLTFSKGPPWEHLSDRERGIAREIAAHYLRLGAPKIIAQRDAEWRERLLSDEIREHAGRAAYLDFDPDGAWETLDHNVRASWEGNTAAGLEAAIDQALPDGGGDQ